MVHNVHAIYSDENAVSGLSDFRDTLFAEWKILFHDYGFPYLVLAVMSVLAILVGFTHGFVDGVFGIAKTMFGLLVLLSLIMLMKQLYLLMFKTKSESPSRDLLSYILKTISDPVRMAKLIHLMFLFSAMAWSFSVLKSSIAFINPFSWDLLFKDLDKALHFGRLPHEWLGWVTSSPVALFLIGALYNIWFFLLFLSLYIFHTRFSGTRIGLQYINTFYLSWLVIGFFMATAFSSAGPAFFENLGLGTDYSSLMTDLNSANENLPVWALDAQKLLWDGHTGVIDMRLGISAFPSMHVAIACVMAFGASAVSRFWGIVTWVFAAIIMIGSVSLGWHYAVDGYASLLAVAVLWFVSGKLSDLRWSRRQPS